MENKSNKPNSGGSDKLKERRPLPIGSSMPAYLPMGGHHVNVGKQDHRAGQHTRIQQSTTTNTWTIPASTTKHNKNKANVKVDKLTIVVKLLLY